MKREEIFFFFFKKLTVIYIQNELTFGYPHNGNLYIYENTCKKNRLIVAQTKTESGKARILKEGICD